jgi:hypothetical protein
VNGGVSTARIDKAVVSGVFSLDGQHFDVDNNVWLVGDDDEVLVSDAPHDAADLGTVFTGDTLFSGGRSGPGCSPCTATPW